MTSMLLDGEAIAQKIYNSLKKDIKRLPRSPRLSALVVGDPVPTTRIFLERKKQACEAVGIEFRIKKIKGFSSRTALLARLRDAIQSSRADGIIIQLPLPSPFQKNVHAFLRLIPEDKDADCLSERWLGKMQSGRMGVVIRGKPVALVPPVAGALAAFLKELNIDPKGKPALIIGWGELVGKPCTAWLLHKGATVMVAQRTESKLSELLAQAEIIVTGTGIRGLVFKNALRPDAVIIDAGVSAPEGKILGDINVSEVAPHVRAITPTPGGVGPVTVAVLLENVVKLARARL